MIKKAIILFIFFLVLLGLLYIPLHRITKNQTVCVRRMGMLSSAAASYAIEHNLPPEHIIHPKALRDYFRPGEPMHCPLGKEPYGRFSLGKGPVCPHSENHTRAFRKQTCAYAMANLWDASISYAAAHTQSWDTVIDPGVIYTSGHLYAKAGRSCLSGTAPYPSFILREGPHCPNTKTHKPDMDKRHNAFFFDSQGRIDTNVPLAKAVRLDEIYK